MKKDGDQGREERVEVCHLRKKRKKEEEEEKRSRSPEGRRRGEERSTSPREE